MQGDYIAETTDSEEITRVIEASLRDVSISSIKTQDSIENNSMIINLDEEEHREIDTDVFRLTEMRHHVQLQPYLTLKETQQAITHALSAPRRRLEVKPLHEIIQRMSKISEDFQAWRKQDL